MKILLYIGLIIFLSGCATTDWNTVMYGNPNGANPDNLVCPNCYSLNDAQNISANIQIVKCYYCGYEFQRAEGKKLYNIALSQQQTTVNVKQSSSIDAVQLYNAMKSTRQPINIYSPNINPLGSRTNPIYIKEKKDYPLTGNPLLW